MDSLSKKFSKYLLVSSLGSSIIGSIFVIFLSFIKGFDAKQISFIVGTTPLIVLPIFLMWGSILDKYKNVIRLSKLINLSNIVTIVLLILINNFILFFIINLVRSILLQPGGTLNDKYLLNISKVKEGSYGHIRVMLTIGYGLAGIIAPIAIKLGGVYLAIIVGSILILLSIFTLNKLSHVEEDVIEKNETSKKSRKGLLKSIIELLKNKRYLRYLIIISVIWGTQNAAAGYGIQIMLIDLKVSDAIISLIPFVMVIFEIVLLLTYDKIKILEKTDIALLISLITLSVRWAIMIFTNSYIVILIITMLHGIVTGIVLQIQNKIVGNIVPPEQHFIAFILMSSLSGTILPSILNLTTGVLYSNHGIRIFGMVYLVLAIIALILLSSKIFQRKKA
ncbi:MFS transporter [Clostridium sp. AL.422]|uniref:MFS transporter n=1 Tax=Clostridium TaxID=1485 RepID=UPI00293DA8E4|nr:MULTISPECIES: MFS transporter [unclassified Clostridium]MDV4150738.1 MFS transporter [Clostridium sp. AL.422]